MQAPTKEMTAMATAAVLAIGLAACGSSSSSSSSASGSSSSAQSSQSAGVSSAVNASVTHGEAALGSFSGPTAKVTPPAAKRIVAITCSSQGYGCVQGALGVQQAGQALGWKVTIVDGKGDPSVQNSAVEQAVVQKANGIVLLAVNPALVGGGLAMAKAAKIPVISTFVPKFPGPSANAYVSSDHVQGGKLLADWVIKDSGGKAHVLMLNDKEFPELVLRNAALVKELSASCSGCKIVNTLQFSIGTMAQQLAGQVTSALQSDPTINYVVAPYDSSGIFAAQGIRQAGKSGTVKLVGAEGDSEGIKAVQAGAEAVDLATVPPWGGWAAMDLLARQFAGKPLASEPLPQRLFDKSNVPSGSNGWSGDVNYQTKFKALWGK